MASCSSVLSEEQLMCSICLEVFIDPVTTPCGHNYCKACITKYWDSIVICLCPICKKTFNKRPDVFVNMIMSELAAQIRKAMSVEASSNPDHSTKHKVSCDICTGRKFKAKKSCLVCVASYCKIHLKPHLRVARLIKHKLINPVKNLEDRICVKHDRPLELFCRTDQTCVCQFCTVREHKAHNTVPIEQECEERKTLMKKTKGEVQKMIQERLEKVQLIKFSVESCKRDAERDISDSVEVFTALVRSIERNQAEIIEVIEENQKAVEKQADGFIKELEKEITGLRRRKSELKKLSHTKDNLHFLQHFTSVGTPPPTKDWSEIHVHSGRSVVASVRRAVSPLEDTLNTEVAKLLAARKMMEQYAVDVTLDRDTAHPYLILSGDGKQVRLRDAPRELPKKAERFEMHGNVLGKQSFSSGRFYYEVQVKGKNAWILGVARESINRKAKITVNTADGLWTMTLKDGHYTVAAKHAVLFTPRVKPQKVGVFVDYEEGQVSFFDVAATSLMYSYTGCTFTEKLYPFFCPSPGGKNYAPLIITPVNLQS